MKTYKAKGNLVRVKRTGRASVICEYDARGRVIAMHVGDLVSQSYSDATPAVTYAYDALGRQTQATDAVGTTVFAYNAYGEQESETVSGLYSKTLTRHRDAYGRDIGYSLDGSRKVTVEYDGDTGRIGRAQMGGGWMSWDYLPGTDLKSSLTYPNGATAAWTYEDDRDLLTRVANTVNGTVTSQYDYTHDLLGRRAAIAKSGSMMAAAENQTYGYNVRDELISGQGLTYAYDDIGIYAPTSVSEVGNRTAAEGRTYAANSLNQYTAIDTFEPEYDADGNQTRVLTSTGEWTVEYNAENRPIRWTQGNKVITMGFDRMGRRVFYKEMEGNRQITHTVFLYDGYLCIQQLFSNSPWNVYKEFIWDPTEPLATRPLCFRQYGQRSAFLLHDGNKNVTDVVTVGPFNEPVAHYDYAPFGAVTATGARALTNPFRFSSEFYDDTLALVYYNYRHYNPKDGRWLGRDNEKYVTNLYSFLDNHPPSRYDQKGLKYFEYASDITWDDFQGEVPEADLRGQRIAETVLMSPVLSINAENIAISIKSLEDNCVCVYATAKHVTWRFRFSEKRSWATEEAKSSWQTLAHERAHINIYLNAYKTSSLPTIEVCAETYDEAVNRALRALRGERDALLKSCWREQHNRNNQFDAETNHGLIEDKENEWEETLYSEVNW